MKLRRRYELECAHRLTKGLSPNHKCRRLHGHRYILTLEVEGPVFDTDGMIIEYSDLDSVVGPIIRLIDHHDLNTLNERCSTVLGGRVSENPTVELLAEWFGHRLQHVIAGARGGKGIRLKLTAVYLEEDSNASVVWEP